ncbi:MAG: DNA polymerase III subunit epsilon [Flavobacteriaceae bacterium]|nr:DNA polymerase III subunit epsilon [Flavobacteriaceae bacterium]
MYAIVDIETTGGKFNEEGITEIAIYKFDGNAVVDKFISLVNPEKPIQPFVVNLTGINNKMLRNAPKFYEVAKRIIEITANCVLVAHNTSFDYRILRTEFDRIGYNFEKETLCTVSLSKKLIPNLESYSLGKLCRSLGIAVADRHRASGDAEATIKLLKLLMLKDTDKTIIKKNIKPIVNDKIISEKLTLLLEPLPRGIGIFYLHDSDGNILFIGKSASVKKEVLKIFIGSSTTKIALQKKVQSISTEETGNLLITKIKYIQELQKNKPKYNKKYHTPYKKYAIELPDMLVINKGRTLGEKSVILIENNKYKGYGYFDLNFQINSIEIIKNLINDTGDSAVILPLIDQYLKRYKSEKIIYLNT